MGRHFSQETSVSPCPLWLFFVHSWLWLRYTKDSVVFFESNSKCPVCSMKQASEEAMPEIETRPVLSAADHEHFLEHGYIIVPNIVSPETIAEILPVLEKDQGKSNDGPELRACASERLIAAIGELFGQGLDPVCKEAGRDMVRRYEPDAEWGDQSAHVDDAYPTIMPNGWAIGCFLFLTRVVSGGGAFIYFPGSFWRIRTLMERNWQCAKDAVALPANSGPPHECLASPGDAILFHHLMGHRGSPNIDDPEVTRHAILSRWRPEARLVPGLKSFADMTTIEKANSARYAAFRSEGELPSPTEESNDASTVLREGLSGLGHVNSCALLYFGGGVHILYHNGKDPESGKATIHHRFTEDLIHWRQEAVADVDARNVRTLQLHQYGLEVVLAVTSIDGTASLYSSQDLETWEPIGQIEDCVTATPWFTYFKYASKVASGHTLFTVSNERADEIVCSWGERWEDAGRWSERPVAARAPTGHEVVDLTVAAQYSEKDCAFVADLAAKGEPTTTQPHYALTKDTAVARERLRPLRFVGDTAPRCIRILNRAQNYWMVGYLQRSNEGEDGLFWGAIDWLDDSPTLVQLVSPNELDRARAIVGFL